VFDNNIYASISNAYQLQFSWCILNHVLIETNYVEILPTILFSYKVDGARILHLVKLLL
jgi:hypothetical protein